MRIEAISIGIDPPREVNVIIEVPVGGEPIKYEMDKEAGTLVVDRFLYTAMRYPGNYGFIPHTLSNDGDPCDVLIANTRAIVPGAVMSVRPVGVLLMEDEAGGDEKIIAVPSTKLTQRYAGIKTTSDLPEITLQQIQHFFEHYKDLEPGKWVKVLRWGSPEDAHRLIEEGIARAKEVTRRHSGASRNANEPGIDTANLSVDFAGSRSSLRPRPVVIGSGLARFTRAPERQLNPRLRQSRDRAGRAQRVHQQTRHRHLADAARHRRDRAGDLRDLGESDVADQLRLALGRGQPVDADIDHGRARLDPVGAHHFRPCRPRQRPDRPARRASAGRASANARSSRWRSR